MSDDVLTPAGPAHRAAHHIACISDAFEGQKGPLSSDWQLMVRDRGHDHKDYAVQTPDGMVECPSFAVARAILQARAGEAPPVDILKRCVEVLGAMPCEKCEHKLSLHMNLYGCEYEQGDAPGGEGDQGPYGERALPPCGCHEETAPYLLLRDLRQRQGLQS